MCNMPSTSPQLPTPDNRPVKTLTQEKTDSKKRNHKKGKRRSPLKSIFKWLSIIIVGIGLLIIATTGITVWMLTPERLTPMVNRYGSEYIDGSIKTSRVELTFWSTFPTVKLSVDSMEIISHAFHNLTPEERSQLPEYADTLVRASHFEGAINLAALSLGRISLSDITIEGLAANLVQYSDSVANYNIVPPSEEQEESAIIPDISINRFVVEGNTPIRFFSLADSTDVMVDLTETSLDDQAPIYRMAINGRGWAEAASQRWLNALPFGLNGGVRWSPSDPSSIALKDMIITVGNLNMEINALADFKEALTLHEFSLKASSLKISDIIDIIPPQLRGGTELLDTDVALSLMINLHGPFKPMEEEWPTADIALDIPSGKLSFDRLKLSTIKASLLAHIDGSNPDASKVTLNDLTLIGRGMGIKITGEATSLLSDPRIKATLKGGTEFGNLPSQLLRRLPFTVSGRLMADGDVSMRMSYLDRKSFHRIRANGSFNLDRFNMEMRDSSLAASATHATLRFGTANHFATSSGTVADSLLTVSLVVDSASMTLPEMTVSGSNLTAGVGMRNVASSADTTQINPIGMSIGADRLSVNMPLDTMNVSLRKIKATGALRRYNQEARRPHLSLGIEAANIRLRDKYNRVRLSGTSLTFNANTKSKPDMSRSVEAVYDSIIAARPELRPDSVLHMAQREVREKRRLQRQNRQHRGDSLRRPHNTATDHSADLDLSVDRSVRKLLAWWQASGSLKARRGTLYTPYLPLRNTIRDLDLTFNTDSVVLRDTRYKLGNSDFLINGVISNIANATTKRNQPIHIDFTLQSDTININQISKAIFAGSAFAEKVSQGTKVEIADTDSDEEMQKSVEDNADPDAKMAFVVPGNLEANLSVKARNVLYADIWARRLNGEIAVANGRVNLHRFAAFTDMGSIDLTALYTAPSLDDLSFAGGLVVRKLNLEKFLHMIPQVDTILPLLREVEGIITADIAMSTELDSLMDLRFHTLNLAMRLSGDSLVLLDSETFRTISKWLLFKKKDRNMIDKMSVELGIKDSRLDVYPFVFDLDRYKLGVSGGNDFEGNYDYHIAVLKSPLPFKFGVTVRGHGDHFKFSLGKARFNENIVSSSRQLTDTARINLLKEIESVFKFGVKTGKREKLLIRQPQFSTSEYSVSDTLTRADSLMFIKEGVITAPPGYLEEVERQESQQLIEEKEKKKKRFLFF